MRYKLLLIPLVVVACAKGEQAQPNAAANTGLTDAAVAGTWTGTAMPVGSDSVVARWTQVCGSGSCVGTTEGTTDTTRATYTIAGDSVMGTAGAHPSAMAGGAMVTDSWVVHPSGDSATGTGTIRLADKPDSIVLQYHFQGTRHPSM
jgi:hypothetical protein